jgi:hypothetical protein
MSTYEHRHIANPNKGGVSRSGFTSDSRMADVDPAFDMPAWAWVAVPALLIGLWVLS